MPVVIDADTHISESTHMWDFLDKELYPRRPVVMSVPTDTVYGRRNAFWLIDGQVIPRPHGKGGIVLVTPSQQDFESARNDIQIGCREMTNIEARLKDMDRLGVQTQIVYPTLFLIYLTDDVELEVGLCRAYNRFLADACSRSGGRIRWVVIPPLRSVEDSIAELRFGKEHGAVGVFFRGIERDRTLDDPYFFPIYKEAGELDLSICVHTGAGCPPFSAIFDSTRNRTFAAVRMLPLIGFRDLIANHIPTEFPKLRFGFIEAGASWVPYVLHQLKRTTPLTKPGERMFSDAGQWGPRLFDENRLFVACEADENVPLLLECIGEDHLIIGSDYGHNDPSEEPLLVDTMRARGDLSDRVLDKILGENAKTLYQL
jgi:uncharacterized protein